MGHLDAKRDQRYLEVSLIVMAIVAAANAIGGGKASNKLQELFKAYENLIYPELKVETESAVARVERIMKRELALGPLKVQAQDYGKKRRRKPK